MSIRLGKMAVDVSVSVRKTISDDLRTTYEVVCHTRFTGRDHLSTSPNGTTRAAGNETVIGKIVLAEGSLRHQEIIAKALAAVRLNFEAAKRDSVFHVNGTSVSFC